MAGLPFDAETFKELWDTWNIRVLIILSFLLQSFLTLFAPLRRSIGDKWFFRFPLWIAYLLADWIAIFVIGLILRAERSHDILVFWAPFLLLHLGGPDCITSFSLEDNEFWIRHLLQLILQVGSTVYVIVQSHAHNKLLLPTLMVLTAGIIKYAERNLAFYLACFEHYGEASSSFVKSSSRQEKTFNDSSRLLFELSPYGTIRNLLVGPLIPPHRREFWRKFLLPLEQRATPEEVLGMIEFELSLLYEALHTKLPVVSCKIGYILRIICMGFISGALLSFRLITKAKQYHDELENSEVWVTYGLLAGAITLDFISIGLLISSDYFITENYSLVAIQNDTIVGWIHNRVINRRMWSKRIPQLNFITHCVEAIPDWLGKLLSSKLALKFSQEFRSMSSPVLEEKVWDYIFTRVRRKAALADTVNMGKILCLGRGDGILDPQSGYNLICLGIPDEILDHRSSNNLVWSVKDLDFVESILTWHIATELCFQAEDHRSTSSSENPDYRGISKLLSDYMFYILHEETVISSKIDDSKMIIELTYAEVQYSYGLLGRKDVCKRMISTMVNPHEIHYFEKLSPYEKETNLYGARRSVLYDARELFKNLQKSDSGGFLWELMSEVWVELMCYAAINCRPNVHAQQPSMGGQLITIVWLLMNHFGLGTQFEADKGAFDHDEGTRVIERVVEMMKRQMW